MLNNNTNCYVYQQEKIGGMWPKLSKNAVIFGNHGLVSGVTAPFFSFLNVVLLLLNFT